MYENQIQINTNVFFLWWKRALAILWLSLAKLTRVNPIYYNKGNNVHQSAAFPICCQTLRNTILKRIFFLNASVTFFGGCFCLSQNIFNKRQFQVDAICALFARLQNKLKSSSLTISFALWLCPWSMQTSSLSLSFLSARCSRLLTLSNTKCAPRRPFSARLSVNTINTIS